MKTNLLKLAILTAAVLTACYWIIWRAPASPENYLNVINDKHRLLESAPSPRIILIGGSNLAFGVDSGLIASALGQEVVNMGLHNGLGLRYIMNEVKDRIRSGDTVVICHEYDLNLEPTNVLLELSIFFPRAWTYFEFPDVKVLLEKLPIALQRRFEGLLRSKLQHIDMLASRTSYQRSGFNRYGDNTGHLGAPTRIKTGDSIRTHPYAPKTRETIVTMNRFFHWAQQRGARVFFVFPPSPKTYFSPKKESVKRLFEVLKKQLEFPILGTPEEYAYPENCFYDTIYHLNQKGRLRRTETLIRKLSLRLGIPVKPGVLTVPPSKPPEGEENR